MPLTLTTSPGGLNSILVAGSQSAPTANTTICTCTPDTTSAQANAEGTLYKANILTYQTGTADANTNNMFLVVNGVAVGQLLSTNVAGGNSQVARILVPAGASVAIVSGNTNAGAGSIYHGSLSLTKIQKGGYPVV